MLINAKHGKNRIVSGALQKLENISEIHEVYGRYDIVAKIEAESLSKMRKFIQNKIMIIEGIVRCESLFVSDVGVEEEAEEEPEEEIEEDEFA